MALRPAIFDRDILALDMTGLGQSLAERSDCRCIRPWCVTAKETDYRQPLLLRSHLPDYRPKQQSDREIAPHHYSMTSSARARTDGGIVSPSALAVLRLTTSSNRVGCWAGVSPGRAPFSILSISAACMATPSRNVV